VRSLWQAERLVSVRDVRDPPHEVRGAIVDVLGHEAFSSGGVMLNLRFVGSGRVESREVPVPAIDARHAGPSGLATVTMMALTPRGDGK